MKSEKARRPTSETSRYAAVTQETIRETIATEEKCKNQHSMKVELESKKKSLEKTKSELEEAQVKHDGEVIKVKDEPLRLE